MIKLTTDKQRALNLIAFLDLLKMQGITKLQDIEKQYAGASASYLSQVRNKTRTFTARQARKYELIFGLDEMYFEKDGGLLHVTDEKIIEIDLVTFSNLHHYIQRDDRRCVIGTIGNITNLKFVFATKIAGNTLQPFLKHNDILFVDYMFKETDASDNDYLIYECAGGVLIRKAVMLPNAVIDIVDVVGDSSGGREFFIGKIVYKCESM